MILTARLGTGYNHTYQLVCRQSTQEMRVPEPEISRAATMSSAPTTDKHESRVRFLDAALELIRTQGYASTTVDDLCAAAGLTKGSFFHHFKSKEDLALAAADHFGEMAENLFAGAPYHSLADPLARILGYVDFRRSLLQGPLPAITCLFGTLVQETYETHPSIREACERHISGHNDTLSRDIAEAKRRHAPHARWSVPSLAAFMHATLQGAFILAKAKQGTEIADECLAHLRRYLVLLFNQSKPKE
jgi:TetR/AcrR family transcriptional repressor of nem operon